MGVTLRTYVRTVVLCNVNITVLIPLDLPLSALVRTYVRMYSLVIVPPGDWALVWWCSHVGSPLSLLSVISTACNSHVNAQSYAHKAQFRIVQ